MPLSRRVPTYPHIVTAPPPVLTEPSAPPSTFLLDDDTLARHAATLLAVDGWSLAEVRARLVVDVRQVANRLVLDHGWTVDNAERTLGIARRCRCEQAR